MDRIGKIKDIIRNAVLVGRFDSASGKELSDYIDRKYQQIDALYVSPMPDAQPKWEETLLNYDWYEGFEDRKIRLKEVLQGQAKQTADALRSFYQPQLEKLEAKIRGVEVDRDSYSHAVNVLSAKCDKLESENASLKGEIERLTSECDALNDKFQNRLSVIKDLESQLQALQAPAGGVSEEIIHKKTDFRRVKEGK